MARVFIVVAFDVVARAEFDPPLGHAHLGVDRLAFVFVVLSLPALLLLLSAAALASRTTEIALLFLLFHMPQRGHAWLVGLRLTGRPRYRLRLLVLAIGTIQRHHIGTVTPHQRHLAVVVVLRVFARLQTHRPMAPIIDRDHHGM